MRSYMICTHHQILFAWSNMYGWNWLTMWHMWMGRKIHRGLVGKPELKRPLRLFVFGATAPQWALASSFTRFLDHTQRRITVGSTPLNEWSARRRDLCLTTHNTHNRQTSMPPVGFEPTSSAGERPQTHALDRAATGAGKQATWKT